MIYPTSYDGILISVPDDFLSSNVMVAAGFVLTTKRDLQLINNSAVGRRLFELVKLRHAGIGTKFTDGSKLADGSEGKTGHVVTIVPNLEYFNNRGTSPTFSTSRNRATACRKGKFGDVVRLPGVGYSARVTYINTALDENIDIVKTRQLGVTSKAFLSLAHEIIHAFHFMSGDAPPASDGVMVGSELIDREELYTLGVGPYKHTTISDNAIRRDLGYPERTAYYSETLDNLIHPVCSWIAPLPRPLRRPW